VGFLAQSAHQSQDRKAPITGTNTKISHKHAISGGSDKNWEKGQELIGVNSRTYVKLLY